MLARRFANAAARLSAVGTSCRLGRSLRLPSSSASAPLRRMTIAHSSAPKKPLTEEEKKATITLVVNGQIVTVPKGSTVLDACKKAKEYVPTLCHHPMLEPVGLCRLCLVELSSAPAPELSALAPAPGPSKPTLRGFMKPRPVVSAPHKLITACTTEAKDGMDIRTETEDTLAAVKFNLGMQRCMHPNKCMTCEVNGRCQFQDLVYKYQVPELLPGAAPDPSADHHGHSERSATSNSNLHAPCLRGPSSSQAQPAPKPELTVTDVLEGPRAPESKVVTPPEDAQAQSEPAVPAGDGYGFSGARDLSSPALIRDMDKCVLCTRCIRACSDVQGMNVYGMTGRGHNEHVSTLYNLPLANTACISCGQCTAVCPVGALVERPHIHPVQHELHARHRTKKVLIASTAPAVRVALGEEFFLDPGTISTGQMVGALRQVGFDYVFDTNYTADLTIMEEANEFLRRLKAGGPFPMFTSCCPGWINLCEKHYPQLLPQLSTCKSPQGMMGALVKRWFSARLNRDPRDIVLVSIMPCVAKKDEIARPQLSFTFTDPETNQPVTIPETDYVLTTRELGHLLKNEDVHFASVKPSNYDRLLGESTGAAALFAVTGGVLEAALRTAYETVTKTELPNVDFHAVRGLGSAQGGVRDAVIPIPVSASSTVELKVAIAHGTKHVRSIVDAVVEGNSPYNGYHLIEVMACPGGCIGGGGQAKSLDPDILKKRAASVYEIDAKKEVRRSHKNPEIVLMYENYLTDGPGGHTSHEALHTHYTDRSAQVKHHADATHPEGALPEQPHVDLI